MKSLLIKIVLFYAIDSIASTGIGIQSDWDIQGKVGLLCEDGPQNEDYPTCECLKKMPIIGNLAIGPPDIPSAGDAPGFADDKSVPHISSDNDLIISSGSVSIDGLECRGDDNQPMSLKQTIIYMLNIEVTGHTYSYENSYVKFKDQSSDELKMTFKKNITWEDSMYIVSGEVEANGEVIHTMGPKDNICGPYQKGAMRNIVYPILNTIVFNGQGCPIQKGTSVIVKKMYPVTLIFDDLLKCGDYKMNIGINAPEEEFALELMLKWTVSENLHCE